MGCKYTLPSSIQDVFLKILQADALWNALGFLASLEILESKTTIYPPDVICLKTPTLHKRQSSLHGSVACNTLGSMGQLGNASQQMGMPPH